MTNEQKIMNRQLHLEAIHDQHGALIRQMFEAGLLTAWMEGAPMSDAKRTCIATACVDYLHVGHCLRWTRELLEDEPAKKGEPE